MMGVFKKIWPDVWSARMEYILNNAILALLDYPGSTMLGINRMLADKNYRKKLLTKVKDPVVKSFWLDEFARYNERFATEAIAPIQNKVGQFLSAAVIRNIVGQVKSTIDMREIMDNQKIFIMNLAKGRIGEDNSALLGGMLVTRLQLAAMARVDIPEDQRKDFYLYVDEFQNFATLSFANILSEARKYRLNLILAHQYIEQLEEEVAAAVFGNVGTIVSYRIGATDAQELEKEFAPVFTGEDLVNLSKYEMYLKLMIDGIASNPFSANGLPPVSGETGSMDKVIKVSRERYAKPREIVEEKILRWSGMQITQQSKEKTDEELEEEIKKELEEKKGSKTVEEESQQKEEKQRKEKEDKKKREDKKEMESLAKKTREVMLGGPQKVQAVNFLDKLNEEVGEGKEEKKDENEKFTEKKQEVSKIEEEKRESTSQDENKGKKEEHAPEEAPKKKENKEKEQQKDQGKKKRKTEKELFPYKIICSLCGKESRVSFDPDPSRPVYCKECLKIGKEKEREERSKEKQKDKNKKNRSRQKKEK